MKANRPTTAAMSSPTFTHATACTVPRSSPLLSSSFTPFYPRSQQQLYHPHSGFVGTHDGGCEVSMQHADDLEANQNHFSSWSHVKGTKFYDQQYYASLGGEPYEVSWVPNNGTGWDGGAWQQWVDPVEYAYAEDDTGDSANLFSDSLSYYAGSPSLEQDIYACPTSNTTSVPAFFDKGSQFQNAHMVENSKTDPKTFSSITGSTAKPNVFHSIAIPERGSCASKKEEESSTPSFRKSIEKDFLGYGAKDETKEVASAVTGSKFDSSVQVSMQRGSGFSTRVGELKLTTDMAENVQARTDSNAKLLKLSKEHGSVDAIKSENPISATSNCSDTILSLDNINFKSSPDIIAGNKKSVSKITSIDYLQASSDHYPNMTVPKHVDSGALEQRNGSEALHQEKINSSLSQTENVGSCLNGPHPLVECIDNLSKVLLSSQSKTMLNTLNPSDCLVLERVICMLSHRLFQSTGSEANFCEDPNCQQELETSGDTRTCFVDPGSLQKDFSQFSSMKHIFSPKRDLQNEVLENAPQVSASSSMGGDNQHLSLKKHLEVLQEEQRMLRGEIQKLQEEVAYERAESNATVSTYKKLWSEAQDAVKLSRFEIMEMRAELAGFKQESVNFKHLSSDGLGGALRDQEVTNDISITSIKQGGLQENFSDNVRNSSQGLIAANLHRAITEDGNSTCCDSSLNEVSEVLTGYFDPGIISNCGKIGTPLAKRVKGASKHISKSTSSDHSSKNFALSTTPMILEDDVAQRLSMLLSRQGLDLNKTCPESCVEWPSGSGTCIESLSNVPGEDETAAHNEDYLIWSEASYLVNDKKGVGCAITPNLSCPRKHVFEVEDSDYGLVEGEPSGMDAAVVMGSVCQEDEIEIICFKPGIADSNFTCLKGEPEWEDVVVNVLGDHRSAKKETVFRNGEVMTRVPRLTY